MKQRNIRVKAPASSGNLGAGVDCGGMALDWYGEFDFVVGALRGLAPFKKISDVRAIHFHPFSRRELRYASENKGFRFGKMSPKTDLREPGIEPGTCPPQTDNHTTRPNGLLEYM